ncbi:MAG: hypothetical protein KAW12_09005 [Candidatus Aminicenantes bacterium]|nr:hypothetical protein [Candidatus Aminicenantes bacterium]
MLKKKTCRSAFTFYMKQKKCPLPIEIGIDFRYNLFMCVIELEESLNDEENRTI